MSLIPIMIISVVYASNYLINLKNVDNANTIFVVIV